MRHYWFLILITSVVFGQVQYPKDYFSSPLDIPLQLAGNFGELRPNHIHSGFDFKTQQKEGFKVFATADGYVSRIKISEIGYGKAVYITHPNGYTTVYGHLQAGYGPVEQLIKQEQYKAKSYQIDIAFKPGDLLVKKGDVIGVSGNTGGSDGPHLHYEIRDTFTEKIINPLYFGFDLLLPDDKRPLVTSLMVYPLDENSQVNGFRRPFSVNMALQEDGTYLAEKIEASGKIGFGISTADYDNVSWNSNGVYSVASFLNGQAFFGYQFDTFSFDETRYVNALIDYERYKNQKQRVQKLFMKTSYPLSLLRANAAQGIVTLQPNVTQSYRIEVADFFGNMTKVFVPIQYKIALNKVGELSVTSPYLLQANRESIFALDNVTVNFPAHVFLDDFYMDFEVAKGIAKVHNDVVPAFANFSVTFEDSLATAKDREKMFIGLVDGKKVSYYYTKRYKNSFTIYTKTLGTYKLLKDGMPPKIKIDKKVGGKWISKMDALQFTISDEGSGIKSYEGYLNGNWILLEYDPKTKKLIHHFADGVVAEGQNDLKIVITDNVGNSTIFETQFFRSQKP
ncbi:MAG: hypothetical protein RL427_498 [Bacteroidota bacterium]|jgi:murein DD-endopeptidase MepM/ murein hydrolase activator NlpD